MSKYSRYAVITSFSNFGYFLSRYCRNKKIEVISTSFCEFSFKKHGWTANIHYWYMTSIRFFVSCNITYGGFSFKKILNHFGKTFSEFVFNFFWLRRKNFIFNSFWKNSHCDTFHYFSVNFFNELKCQKEFFFLIFNIMYCIWKFLVFFQKLLVISVASSFLVLKT